MGIREIIVVEEEKPQEIQELEEAVETSSFEETIEVQIEQAEKKDIPIIEEAITAEEKKPQEVETVFEDIDVVEATDSIDVEVDQPTEEIKELEEAVETSTFEETM